MIEFKYPIITYPVVNTEQSQNNGANNTITSMIIDKTKTKLKFFTELEQKYPKILCGTTRDQQ